MTERSEPDNRGDDREGESLEDVRDRLSAFVGSEGDEEERPDEPAKELTESSPEGGDSVGNASEGNVEAVPPAGRKATGSNVVVKAAVREHVEDMAVASEFYEPLNEAVNELLADAARRARANGRKTVQARDL
jgi:hypothetical protein